MASKTKTAAETRGARPMPSSLRLEPEVHAAATEAAATAGYSFNRFVAACVEGVIEMINAPDGQMVEPKVVAIARFLKTHKPQKVKKGSYGSPV